MSTPSDPTGATPEGAVPPPAYNAPPPGYSAPPPGYQAPPAYGAPMGYGGPMAPMSDSDQRMWALLAHIGPLVVGFIAPLVIWLMHKEKGRFVEEQAKEALNFQITLLIAGAVFFVITLVTFGIGGILYLSFIGALIFMIMAAIAANKGEAYRYPVCLRLIK